MAGRPSEWAPLVHASQQLRSIRVYQAIQADSAADLARFCAVSDRVPGLGPLDPQALASTHADEHWMLSDGETGVARCSLWWSAAPSYPDHRVGLIGHYAASDSAAPELLALACRRLR